MNEREILVKNWDRLKLQILNDNKNNISEVAFNTWINPLKIGRVENNTIVLLVPPVHAGDGTGIEIIKNNYSSLFKVFLSEFMSNTYGVDKIYEIEFAVEDSNYDYDLNISNEKLSTLQRSNLNPRYTFGNFVVGPTNELAVSAAKAVAEKPGLSFNPLFLYGGPGLGKTHLMHAIGYSIIKNDPSKIVRYVTSEQFTNEVVEAIRNQSTQKMRDIYRSVDVLLLDDVQFIIGKEQTQNELFNSFNELYGQNKAIILSSDKPPKDLKTLDERMKSRFEMGLTVDITPPDYETRMVILRQYAKQHDFEVNDDVIQYIATNITTNIRELEGALNKVYARKSFINEEITVSIAEEAIRDILRESEPRKITLDLIISEVASYYETTKEAIISKKRTKEKVLPRHVSMYLCRELTDEPYDVIGNYMGGRDHTTVINGYKKVNDNLSTNPSLSNDIENLKKRIIPEQ
ncbi:MAG: chromosomal replication initiator protein DnaA [Lachnospiraceae bacterium]|nr:chromosomal replication initiator protein DnaA [Lachnospiraceae bacterium]